MQTLSRTTPRMVCRTDIRVNSILHPCSYLGVHPCIHRADRPTRISIPVDPEILPKNVSRAEEIRQRQPESYLRPLPGDPQWDQHHPRLPPDKTIFVGERVACGCQS